jgi:Txe/YoeB family toxin of Txe-Axe toxin-antitoxin module
MIRAKFRCLKVTIDLENRHSYNLQPVTGEADDEDKSFWEATPSGAAEMNYLLKEGDKKPFELGAYYYINLTPNEDGDWSIRTRTEHTTARRGANGEVKLAFNAPGDWRTLGLKYSTLDMGIDNPEAMKAFSDVESKWDVVFTHAGAEAD